MTINIWDSRDLYLLQQDLRLDPVPDYFWRTFFGTDYYSEDETIKFAELPVPHRKLAPFVQPTSQGKPIFERRGETVKQFTPAYIKVKDAVRVMEARNILPSEDQLARVMVRRLKGDLRKATGEFPERKVIQIDISGKAAKAVKVIASSGVVEARSRKRYSIALSSGRGRCCVSSATWGIAA